MKAKRLISALLALLMLLSVFPVSVFAEPEEEGPTGAQDPVDYLILDEDGESTPGTCTSYTLIDGDNMPTEWTDGFYVVDGSVTYGTASGETPITVKGAASLILPDDCSLTVYGGIQVWTGYSLTIYAQSEGDGMGVLVVDSSRTSDSSLGAGTSSDDTAVTIHGGDITASNHSTASAIGGGGSDSCERCTVTIYGGKISAETIGYGAAIGGGRDSRNHTVNIYGGDITAVSGTNLGSAAIGDGYGGYGTTVNICGGDVKATSMKGASGIGWSVNHFYNYGSVNIYGGKVYAEGGSTDDGKADAICSQTVTVYPETGENSFFITDGDDNPVTGSPFETAVEDGGVSILDAVKGFPVLNVEEHIHSFTADDYKDNEDGTHSRKCSGCDCYGAAEGHNFVDFVCTLCSAELLAEAKAAAEEEINAAKTDVNETIALQAIEDLNAETVTTVAEVMEIKNTALADMAAADLAAAKAAAVAEIEAAFCDLSKTVAEKAYGDIGDAETPDEVNCLKAAALEAIEAQHVYDGTYRDNGNGTHCRKCLGCEKYGTAEDHVLVSHHCVCGYFESIPTEGIDEFIFTPAGYKTSEKFKIYGNYIGAELTGFRVGHPSSGSPYYMTITPLLPDVYAIDYVEVRLASYCPSYSQVAVKGGTKAEPAGYEYTAELVRINADDGSSVIVIGLDGSTSWCVVSDIIVHYIYDGPRHDFSVDEYQNNGDGTHSLKCTGCDEYGDPTGHTYVDGFCVCGDICPHVWEDGVCTVCGCDDGDRDVLAATKAAACALIDEVSAGASEEVAAVAADEKIAISSASTVGEASSIKDRALAKFAALPAITAKTTDANSETAAAAKAAIISASTAAEVNSLLSTALADMAADDAELAAAKNAAVNEINKETYADNRDKAAAAIESVNAATTLAGVSSRLEAALAGMEAVHVYTTDEYRDNGDGTHSRKCENCDKYGAPEEHSFADHYCSICGSFDAIPQTEEFIYDWGYNTSELFNITGNSKSGNGYQVGYDSNFSKLCYITITLPDPDLYPVDHIEAVLVNHGPSYSQVNVSGGTKEEVRADHIYNNLSTVRIYPDGDSDVIKIGGEGSWAWCDIGDITIYYNVVRHDFTSDVYVNNGDGTHLRKCKGCGVYTGPTAHTYVNGFCACGELCPHEWDENGHCTVCGCDTGDADVLAATKTAVCALIDEAVTDAPEEVIAVAADEKTAIGNADTVEKVYLIRDRALAKFAALPEITANTTEAAASVAAAEKAELISASTAGEVSAILERALAKLAALSEIDEAVTGASEEIIAVAAAEKAAIGSASAVGEVSPILERALAKIAALPAIDAKITDANRETADAAKTAIIGAAAAAEVNSLLSKALADMEADDAAYAAEKTAALEAIEAAAFADNQTIAEKAIADITAAVTLKEVIRLKEAALAAMDAVHEYTADVFRDNGDGTHSRKCLTCDKYGEPEEHSFFNHECTDCGFCELAEKTEFITFSDHYKSAQAFKVTCNMFAYSTGMRIGWDRYKQSWRTWITALDPHDIITGVDLVITEETGNLIGAGFNRGELINPGGNPAKIRNVNANQLVLGSEASSAGCSVGDVTVYYTTHDFTSEVYRNNGDGTHLRKCTGDGCELYGAPEAHRYSDGFCVCGELCPHIWGDDGICTVCGLDNGNTDAEILAGTKTCVCATIDEAVTDASAEVAEAAKAAIANASTVAEVCALRDQALVDMAEKDAELAAAKEAAVREIDRESRSDNWVLADEAIDSINAATTLAAVKSCKEAGLAAMDAVHVYTGEYRFLNERVHQQKCLTCDKYGTPEAHAYVNHRCACGVIEGLVADLVTFNRNAETLYDPAEKCTVTANERMNDIGVCVGHYWYTDVDYYVTIEAKDPENSPITRIDIKLSGYSDKYSKVSVYGGDKAEPVGQSYSTGDIVSIINIDSPTVTIGGGSSTDWAVISDIVVYYPSYDPHVYTTDVYRNNGDGTHSRKCTGCDEYGAPTEHTYANGFCVCGEICPHEWDEDGHCTVCGCNGDDAAVLAKTQEYMIGLIEEGITDASAAVAEAAIIAIGEADTVKEVCGIGEQALLDMYIADVVCLIGEMIIPSFNCSEAAARLNAAIEEIREAGSYEEVDSIWGQAMADAGALDDEFDLKLESFYDELDDLYDAWTSGPRTQEGVDLYDEVIEALENVTSIEGLDEIYDEYHDSILFFMERDIDVRELQYYIDEYEGDGEETIKAIASETLAVILDEDPEDPEDKIDTLEKLRKIVGDCFDRIGYFPERYGVLELLEQSAAKSETLASEYEKYYDAIMSASTVSELNVIIAKIVIVCHSDEFDSELSAYKQLLVEDGADEILVANVDEAIGMNAAHTADVLDTLDHTEPLTEEERRAVIQAYNEYAEFLDNRGIALQNLYTEQLSDDYPDSSEQYQALIAEAIEAYRLAVTPELYEAAAEEYEPRIELQKLKEEKRALLLEWIDMASGKVMRKIVSDAVDAIQACGDAASVQEVYDAALITIEAQAEAEAYKQWFKDDIIWMLEEEWLCDEAKAVLTDALTAISDAEDVEEVEEIYDSARTRTDKLMGEYYEWYDRCADVIWNYIDREEMLSDGTLLLFEEALDEFDEATTIAKVKECCEKYYDRILLNCLVDTAVYEFTWMADNDEFSDGLRALARQKINGFESLRNAEGTTPSDIEAYHTECLEDLLNFRGDEVMAVINAEVDKDPSEEKKAIAQGVRAVIDEVIAEFIDQRELAVFEVMDELQDQALDCLNGIHIFNSYIRLCDNGDGTHSLQCPCCLTVDDSEKNVHEDEDGNDICDFCGAALIPVVYTGASLTIESDLRFNFFVELEKGLEPSAETLSFTVGGVPTQGKIGRKDGRLVFTCPVNALQMAETIKVMYTVDGVDYEYEYSVTEYIEELLDGFYSYSDETEQLAMKLINYGHYAQIYLASIHDNVVIGEGGYAEIEKYEDEDIDLSMLPENFGDESSFDAAEGVSLYGRSLYLEDLIGLNFYVQTGENEIISVSCGARGKDVSTKPYKTGVTVVSVRNILASELGTKITVTVETEAGESTFTSSVLDYCAAVIGKNGSGASVDAMAAIYEYYHAACEYVNMNPPYIY